MLSVSCLDAIIGLVELVGLPLAVIWGSYFDPSSPWRSEAGWLPWPPKSRLRCSGLGFKNFVQDGMYLGKMKLVCFLAICSMWRVFCVFMCFLTCCLIRWMANFSFITHNEKSNQKKNRFVSREGFHHFIHVSGKRKFRIMSGSARIEGDETSSALLERVVLEDVSNTVVSGLLMLASWINCDSKNSWTVTPVGFWVFTMKPWEDVRPCCTASSSPRSCRAIFLPSAQRVVTNSQSSSMSLKSALQIVLESLSEFKYCHRPAVVSVLEGRKALDLSDTSRWILRKEIALI